MGFAAVSQASGSFSRAEAEFNLLKKENQNRLRVDNSVASARGQELDGRAGEAAESERKYVDTFLQLKAAEKAEEAAKWGFWGSVANGLTKLGSNIAGGKSGFDTAFTAIGDGFAALGAYFAMLGAKDEVKLLAMQFGDLSEGAKADKAMVAAMDGNPTL